MRDVTQPSESTSTRKTGISMARMFGYGSGNFALSMLGLVIGVNLLFFYTDYVGLSPQLVAMSLLIAKLFDAVTDPVMGYISDRTNTRWGRRRPFFMGAAIPLGIAFYFLFSPPVVDNPEDHQTFLWLYMLGCYVATYFVWTIAAIPHSSLGAELTDDYQERVKVYAVRELCALIGLMTATFLPGFLIYFYGGRVGYSYMSVILGVAAAFFLLVAGFSTQERAEFRGREPIGPYKSWVLTFRNPHFRKLILAYICSSIASAVPAVLIIYIATYIVGTPDWWAESVPGWIPTWSFYLLLYFGGGIAGVPLWNRVAAKLGKRDTWLVGLVLAVLLSACCYLLDEGTVLLYSTIMATGGLILSNYMILPSSMVADLIDWDEAETGRRREGAYFAIIAFILKTCTALTGFTVLMVMHQAGYEPGVPQTPEVRLWMLRMYAIFPATLYLLAGVMLLRFNFTRSDLDEVQRKLGRERAA